MKVTNKAIEQLSASEMVAAYADHTLSPVDVIKDVLARTATLNPQLNAFYHIDETAALEAAAASEQRWQDNAPQGLLDGVPVSVKDSIAVKGMPMLRGSEAYRGTGVDSEDSPPAARLKEQGAIIFAKTTMPDFGMFAAGVSSAFGIVRNPWNTDFNTGGSSSGGGAAVAAGLGPVTVGSDVGGSVRIPASLCGLSTLKPTQGRIPHLPASPIRSAGPLARSMQDVALMMSVLSLPDARDQGSLPYEDIAYHQQLNSLTQLNGMRIGLMLDTGFGLPTEAIIIKRIKEAADVLVAAGAQVELMTPLMTWNPLPLLDALFAVKSNKELHALPPEAQEKVHAIVRAVCLEAEGLSDKAFQDVLAGIEKAKAEVVAATARYDVVISPTMPVVNYPADQVSTIAGKPFSAVNYTSLFNQTGQPAASVCCGFDERGLPIGLQIIGQCNDDLRVMQVAAVYECQRGWELPWPELAK